MIGVPDDRYRGDDAREVKVEHIGRGPETVLGGGPHGLFGDALYRCDVVVASEMRGQLFIDNDSRYLWIPGKVLSDKMRRQAAFRLNRLATPRNPTPVR